MSTNPHRDLGKELVHARQVQRAFLPSEPLNVPGYGLFEYYNAADEVGGDFYDHWNIEPGRIAIALGDACGHGVSAALVKCGVSSLLSGYFAMGLDIVEVLNRVNAYMTERSSRFATMVLAALDLSNDEVTMVNAGHCPPLLRKSDGTIVDFGASQSGLPSGIMSDHSYSASQFSMEKGDALLFYSDGITEATNSVDEQYGELRLRSILCDSSGTAEEIGQAILNDLERFVGNTDPSDDRCLLCLKRE